VHIVVAALLTVLWSPQQKDPCADLASCRAAAEAARESRDYEAFHDLAWATYRKGKSNDPDLMLLVARAQSLSGRPGDALVMLERIAALGVRTDAESSEDFARVRALPRWKEVAAKFAAVSPAGESPTTKAESGVEAPPANAAEKTGPEKSPAKPAGKPAAETTKKPTEKAEPPAEKSEKKKEEKAAAEKEKEAAPKRDPNAPLAFTTTLSPDALAYDAVSRRFLIADRKARRVAVVDEHSGQVATMVGALGAPGEIVGMAIDAQQGDLWIASNGEDNTVLHKLQLISGRVLTTVTVDLEEPLAAITHARGTGLIGADVNGVLWNLKPDGKAVKLTALEYVPQALTVDAKGRLYISGGTSRFARFAIGPSLRRIDTIAIDGAIPRGAPFVAVGTTLKFIVPADGSFEIRNIPIK
jgi:hypothetical protein